MTANAMTNDATAFSPRALPRLLPDAPVRSLREHVEHFGARPARPDHVFAEVERSGLKGRGGATFPMAVKLRAVAERRGPRIVVANGTEGEPASTKDKALMSLAPHLVLDGAVLAAQVVGAREAILCVERSATQIANAMQSAIAERERYQRDPVPLRIERAPSRYVSGEESALVAWLNGGEAKPTFVPPRPFEKGVRGRPTLVQNVETLAHLALIARFGGEWFRGLGTEVDPGSALVTCSGAFQYRGVSEIPLGLPLARLFEAASTDVKTVQAVLVGGYFGTWLPHDALETVRLASTSLQTHGGSLGCGVVAALPYDHCGLVESARVARWLASQNAGQCGPCVNGLDAIARAMEVLVRGDRRGDARRHLDRWLTMVKGRGACKLPDGTSRFVASSLEVFADEIAVHGKSGRCSAPRRTKPLLPLPNPEGWR
jgi:NADH:ubiquinone oxidoreductase subunit F (NADH-binding)